MTQNLLYKRDISINDKIQIYIPSVREILDAEDEYYGMVSLFTAMPIDMMVQLEDAGIDFTTINEYDLFLLIFNGLKEQDAHLIFRDLSLRNFVPAINEQNNTVVLLDRENDIVIDRAIHGQIAATLRRLHHMERNNRKPANKEAKEYLLERARAKLKRRRNKKEDSQLESLIIAMVNTEQYKYDFEGTLELSIYQFNESVRQVIKKIDYDNRMYGVYAGTVNVKDLSRDDLNWLSNN